MSWTSQTTTAAVSIGLPSASLTLACADSWLRIRVGPRMRSVNGFTHCSPVADRPAVPAEQLHDPGLPGTTAISPRRMKLSAMSPRTPIVIGVVLQGAVLATGQEEQRFEPAAAGRCPAPAWAGRAGPGGPLGHQQAGQMKRGVNAVFWVIVHAFAGLAFWVTIVRLGLTAMITHIYRALILFGNGPLRRVSRLRRRGDESDEVLHRQAVWVIRPGHRGKGVKQPCRPGGPGESVAEAKPASSSPMRQGK